MQRLVWVYTSTAAFTALFWPWQLEDDGTVLWQGEKCRWEPLT